MRLEIKPIEYTEMAVDTNLAETEDTSDSSEFADVLRAGIASARSGDRQTARRLLTKASEADPRSEDAWMWLASVSDYPEELLAFLNHVLDINPHNDRAVQWHAATRSLLAKTLVHRAVASREEGSIELARQCLDRALAYDQDCEMAWFWLASISASDGERLECLERVATINPENVEARQVSAALVRAASIAAFAQAKAAAVAGKRKKALGMLDEILEKAPDNAEAWILASHLSLGFEEKLHYLEKALEFDTDNPAARSSYDFLKRMIVPTESDPEPEPSTAPEKETTSVEASHDETETIPESSESAPEIERFGDLGDEVEPISIDDFNGAAADPTREITESDFQIDTEPSTAADSETSPSEIISVRFACPFCGSGNEKQAFECSTCRATLTLDDIEALRLNNRVDREIVQQAITRMEAEWNLRDFNEVELTVLGIGHFNLKNFEPGLKYLQEAARSCPDNVILAGQVNAIAIRLDEVWRQYQVNDAVPKGKTILVVDDSPTVRKLISGKLEKSGHNVVSAVDGVEALERLGEITPDLVLLDIAMPRLDGYEVCKQIRLNPNSMNIPVVMISGKDGFFDMVRGRLAGTTGYITKPFGPETLMKALETYLGANEGKPHPNNDELS